MYYFDQNLLQQYMNQKISLKVFVDQEWYTIADMRDLEDPMAGLGYDAYNGDHRFDYREIEQIQVGGRTISLDQLQAQKTGHPADSNKKADSSAESESSEDMPEEEPKKEKEPDLSWYSPHYNLGHLMLAEKRRRKC